MITKEGANGILRCIFAKTIATAKIRLAQNNAVPADADLVLGDLTEASFPGYAEVDIGTPAWPAPATNMSNEAESDGPTITWTATSGTPLPQTCYLVYVVLNDGTADFLFAVGRFSPGKTVTLAGDTITVKLNWYAWNGTP